MKEVSLKNGLVTVRTLAIKRRKFGDVRIKDGGMPSVTDRNRRRE
jgi:hypothetical protein